MAKLVKLVKDDKSGEFSDYFRFLESGQWRFAKSTVEMPYGEGHNDHKQKTWNYPVQYTNHIRSSGSVSLTGWMESRKLIMDK